MTELAKQDLEPKPPQEATAKIPPPNPHFQRSDSVPPGAVDVSYKLDEGPVNLRWPDELSPESVEEFEYWVRGLIQRARRKAGIPGGTAN